MTIITEINFITIIEIANITQTQSVTYVEKTELAAE